MPFNNTYLNKKVVITGHTGFKGSWLAVWLDLLGAKVYGIALEPPTTPSHFEAGGLSSFVESHIQDVRDDQAVRHLIEMIDPDFVFHLAAQPLVKESYVDPLTTWQTNVLGTANVLDALRFVSNVTAVMITSDKCYDNVEWSWGYRENDRLGGPDPYSASKGGAEIAISSFYKSYFKDQAKARGVKVASARAGNVIGGGDWARDRIVPDCVKSWSEGIPVIIRNPKATRPWQHVLEPLSGYLALGAELDRDDTISGESFNFGPRSEQNRTVKELVEPMSRAWALARWIDGSEESDGPYESTLLKLNCDKAIHFLKWSSVLTFEETVAFTVEWYRDFYETGGDVLDMTRRQISTYMRLAEAGGLKWTK